MSNSPTKYAMNLNISDNDFHRTISIFSLLTFFLITFETMKNRCWIFDGLALSIYKNRSTSFECYVDFWLKIYLILTASERISPHCLYQFTDSLEHFNLPVTLTLENNLDFKITKYKNGTSYDANFVLESLWGNVIHYRPKIDWHKNGPRKTNQRY